MKTLIRGAQLFRKGKLVHEDLLIDGEKIAAPGPADQEWDASGLTIFPGLIDVHVHFRDPGLEKKEGWLNGSRAAARGGVTTVFEIQNNPPLAVDADRIREKHAIAGKGIVDFGCYGNLLPQTVDTVAGMAPLVPGFKLFMGGSTGMQGILDRGALKEMFAAAGATGKTIVAHCEDEEMLLANKERAKECTAADHHLLRPAEGEARAIELALEMVGETGALFHIFHLTTRRGVELLATAKKQGLPVTASVSPHNLIFTNEDTARVGNKLRVNPAIQTGEDREALLDAFRTGLLDLIGTDHAPHFLHEKERPYHKSPSGIPSIEFLLPLILGLVNSEVLELERAIQGMTSRVTEIFGIEGKGSLEPGMDADLVAMDLNNIQPIRPEDVISRAGYTPYEGREVPHYPVRTLVRGQVVFDGETFLKKPWGKPVRYGK